MEQAFSIWSPVITAQLNTPRRLGDERSYAAERLFRMLEDLKIKVKQSEVIPQGQAVEVRVKIDILCLLEDPAGRMHLVKKEETLRERVAYTEFDRSLEREEGIGFVINVKDISFDGELKGGEIRVRFLVEYTLIATREQVVRLWTGEQSEVNQESLSQLFERLEAEVSRLAEENQELHRKVFFYQRDISSLKRGISKLEKRNSSLLKDISLYQRETESLRQNLQEKESHIYRLKHYPRVAGFPDRESSPGEQESEPSLGSRIKRLFLNNLI
ncbi:hypothetical protein [Syntrophomonas curvata]